VLLSSEHFSVDGTLIEAWASMKSFKPKQPPAGGQPTGGGRNAPADFKGEKRSNETHRSTDRDSGVTGPHACQIIGRWRIVEADLWDHHYLDLVEPAYLRIGDDGWTEFAFGVVHATAELEYAKTIVFFRWHGFDEGDEITGDGSAELQEDGSLEIELSFDNGDDATLTARRE
jgi:hypothetical protein